jgi:hypothetical protein
MNKLSYFKGKVCTVLTSPTTRFFDEVAHTNVFVGLVEDVDEYGVWLLQLTTRKKSFFTLNSLVGIIEEMVVSMTEEESRTVREQVKGKGLPEKNPQQLISLDSLKTLKKDNTEKK